MPVSVEHRGPHTERGEPVSQMDRMSNRYLDCASLASAANACRRSSRSELVPSNVVL